MAFLYSRGTNKYDNSPAQLKVKDFDEFADAVTNDKSSSKGLAYICAALSEGVHYEKPDENLGTNHWRLKNYGLARQYLAFDFDGFESPSVFSEVCEYFSAFNCLIYTTASHTEAAPRARALVELNREISPLEGEELGQAAQGGVESSIGTRKIKFDDSVYRATQPIYTPVTTSKIIRHHGTSLDVDATLDKYLPKQTGKPAGSPESVVKSSNALLDTVEGVARMLSALSAIPAKIERRLWCDLLYSVKAHGFSSSEHEAREWSKTAGEYDPVNNPHGYDEKAFNDVWKYPVQSIGPGTLYHHAKQFGWLGKQAELFATTDINANPDIFGDVFNGKFFAKIFINRMVYCYPRSKWLKFNEMVWEWCDSGEELQAAKHAAMNIAKYAAEIFSADPTNPSSKKLIQHAQNSQNLSRLQAMLQTAAAELSMGIGDLNQLDSDAMLLGCKNGIVCLNTGTLLAPDPKMLITRQVNAELDPDAPCPNWLRFLDQCFISDEETIDYIQKALGYSLTGMVNEEVLHFCFGMGRNGKSVFANVMTKLMGDYAITAPAEMLMRRDRNSATNDIARLCGSRLVLANETRSDQRFDDLTIKTLVSTERISARFLHNEFFEFWPTFKIWIRGNHKPVITDESNGAWRRIRLVPFENNIPEDLVDPELENKLLAEKDGILAWMVEGALKWKKEGLTSSPRIKSASNQYRSDCDVIGDFIDENCTLGQGLKVTQVGLWNVWQEWARENGYFCGSKKTFTRRLKDRGINADGYHNGVRAYVGVGLAKILHHTTPSQDVGVNPDSSYKQLL